MTGSRRARAGGPTFRARPGQEVRQELVPAVGEDRLGMELDSLDRELAMAQSHHESVLGLSGDLEYVRNRRTLHDERVIARRRERIGETREHADAIVSNLRGLAVHHVRRADDGAAVKLADALQAEAYAEHRRSRLAEGADR